MKNVIDTVSFYLFVATVYAVAVVLYPFRPLLRSRK